MKSDRGSRLNQATNGQPSMTVCYFNLLHLIYPGPAHGAGKPGIIVPPASGCGKGNALGGKHFTKRRLDHAREIENTCHVVVARRGVPGTPTARVTPASVSNASVDPAAAPECPDVIREKSSRRNICLAARHVAAQMRSREEISIWLFPFLFFIQMLSSSSLHLLVLKHILLFLSFPL